MRIEKYVYLLKKQISFLHNFIDCMGKLALHRRKIANSVAYSTDNRRPWVRSHLTSPTPGFKENRRLYR